MKLITLLPYLMVTLTIAETISNGKPYRASDRSAEAVNKNQSSWRLAKDFRKDTSMSYTRKLLGLHTNSKPSEFKPNLENVDIPESFDWRDYYPNCSTLRDIRDQGSCGTCWAFAAVEVISDRICIHSKGKYNVYVSANDLFACCDTCGDDCEYGFPMDAFKYWIERGIVSGGPYRSRQGCRPYEIAPCSHFEHGTLTPCELVNGRRPKCIQICRYGYSVSYDDDLNYGTAAYTLPNNVTEIQFEIMTNGPVTATFNVYDDFLDYKNGVYIYSYGNYTFEHVVKILGWGVENDTDYWLAANSWNTEWGDKGFFKFLRGENYCDIEEQVSAGIPI